MAAIANVVISDFATPTPVAHTFSPSKTVSDFAQWEDRAAGVYIGFNKLTLQLSRPTGNSKIGNRNLRLLVKLETPKMEVISNSTISGIAPAPTVSYRPVVECIFTLPERCNLQDRKDMSALLKNFLNSATFSNFVENYEVPF